MQVSDESIVETAKVIATRLVAASSSAAVSNAVTEAAQAAAIATHWTAPSNVLVALALIISLSVGIVLAALAWALHDQQLRHSSAPWLLRPIDTMLSYVQPILFIPCVSVAFRWMDCDGSFIASDQCWQAGHAVGAAAVVLLVLPFITIAVLAQSIYINRQMMTADAGARTDARAEVRLLLLKVAVIVVFTLFRTGTNWLKLLLLTVIAVQWVHEYMIVQPFMNPRMNEFQAGCGCVFALAVLCAAVSTAFPEPVLVLMWMVLSPVVGVGGAMATRSWRTLISCTPVFSLTEPSKLGLWARQRARMLFLLNSNGGDTQPELSSESDNGSTRRSLDGIIQLLGSHSPRSLSLNDNELKDLRAAVSESAEAALRWGSARFPKDVALLLQTATYFKATGHSKYMEISALNTARMLSNSMEVQFIVYQRNRELRELGSSQRGAAQRNRLHSSAADRLLIDQHSSMAAKQDIRSRETLVRVWEALQTSSPDVHQLVKLGKRLKVAAESAELHYRSLVKLQRQNISTMRQYGDFLAAVLGRVQKADELHSKADRLEETALARAKMKVQDFRLLQMCQRISGAPETTAMLTLSGDMRNLGEVLHVNAKAAQLLLKAPSSLLGTSGFDCFAPPTNRCVELFLLDHIRHQKGRTLSAPRFALVQDSMRRLRTVQFSLEESPPAENELTIQFSLALHEVEVDMDHFICKQSISSLTVEAASPASHRMLGVSQVPDANSTLTPLRQIELEVLRSLQQEKADSRSYDPETGLSKNITKSFDVVCVEEDAEAGPPARVRVQVQQFNPTLLGSGDASFLVSWHELGADDRPLKRAASRFSVTIQPEPARLPRVNSLSLRKLGQFAPLVPNSRPLTQLTQQTLTFASAGSSWAQDSSAVPISDAEIDALADGGRVSSAAMSASNTMSHNASFRLAGSEDYSQSKAATAAATVREQRVFAGSLRRELSTVTESQRELLSTTQGSALSYGPEKMEFKGLQVGTVQEVDEVDDPFDGMQMSAVSAKSAPDSKATAIASPPTPNSPTPRTRRIVTQSSLDGTEVEGSVGSGGSSGSQTHAARQALSRFLLESTGLDPPLQQLRSGLRLAFIFAVCLGVAVLIGSDTVFVWSREHLNGMVNAGRALRMVQGASVSAAQLGLGYMGVRTGNATVIRNSLRSETDKLRNAWRGVVADAESLDSPATRERTGGLRSLIPMQHPNTADKEYLALNAAMGSTISNLDMLTESELPIDFTAASAPYYSVTVNVPGPIVSSVNETLNLRASQMSEFMSTIQSSVFTVLTVGVLAIGTCLAYFLWAKIGTVNLLRRAPAALLATLSVPAVKLLHSHQKSNLKHFKAAHENKDEDSDMSDSEESEEEVDNKGSDTDSVGTSSTQDMQSRLTRRYGSASSTRTTIQSNYVRKLRDLGNFKAKNLLLFMAQSFLLGLWLAGFSTSMNLFYNLIAEDMARLYSSQQLLSQTIRVAQTATVAVAADRTSLPASVTELQSAIAMSAERLGAVLQGKQHDEVAGGELGALSTDSAAFALFSSDGCGVIQSNGGELPMNCTEFGDGVMSLGLQIVVQRYMQHARLLSSFLALLPVENNFSVGKALGVLVAQNASEQAQAFGLSHSQLAYIINSTVSYQSVHVGLVDVLSTEDPYLRSSMWVLEALLIQQTDTHFEQAWDTFLAENIAYICVSVLIYATFHARRLQVIQSSLDGARALLLAVPTEYLLRNRRFNREYKSFVAKIVSSKSSSS